MNFSLSWVKSSAGHSVSPFSLSRILDSRTGKRHTFLLRVLLDQLDELRSDRQGLVIKFLYIVSIFHSSAIARDQGRVGTYGNLLVVLFPRRRVARAQQRQKLLYILDLGEHLGFHLCLTLQLVGRGVGKLLDVVEREDARVAL